MTHLLTITRRPPPANAPAVETFPFTVPAIRSLPVLDLSAPVTFFVGENGSGKSTLLEGIAAAASIPSVGSEDIERDASLAAQRRLARAQRTSRGFFLRAEDFFGYTKRLSRERAELLARLQDIETEYAERTPYARGLAELPVRASLAEMEKRYGIDLDANSHGQSFLKLFQARFVPAGLYLLDEPEAALSPQSQLGLLAMMLDMVRQDAQFIVATHSPIVLAYPGARIYSFDSNPIAAIPYERLEHVSLTREFLASPERFLRHLE